MKTKKSVTLLLFLILFGLANALQAEDWSGTISGRTIYSNTTVYLTGDVSVTGQITIASGATLTINAYNGNRQINKSFNTSTLFYVESGGGLEIYGNSYHVTIDCGYVYSTSYDAYTSVISNGKSGRIIECKGDLTLNKVTLQNSSNTSGSGNCLYFTNNGNSANLRTVNLTDVIIRGCKASGGPAVHFVNDDYHNATFTRVEISGCYATGAGNDFGCIIRENGGARVNLTLDNCHIHHNHSENAGGAVGWNAAGLSDNKLVIKGNTEIDNNVASQIGGGLVIEARAEIQSANIHHNTAGRGGGIFMKTYDGNQESFSGDGFNLTVSSGVTIHDNTATLYGGGVAMEIFKSNDIGFNPAGEAISPEYRFEVAGGEIYNNKAPQGGGAAFLDKAPKKHYNGSIWSGEYVRNVVISSGSIHDNTCTATSSDTQGAGIYIRKYEDTEISTNTGDTYNYTAAGGAGTITVTASGGNVYNNKSCNNYSNGIGGGIYINNEIPQAPYNSVCSVIISGTSFYGNESDSHGAGIYLTNGSVTMSNGYIGQSGNPNKTYNGNGAGLYIDGGNFSLSGGEVCGNFATGDGGGFYVNDGTCTMTNGYIHDNDATGNGGGVYMNGGDFTHTKGEIGKSSENPNTAINGAGVYMNGGTYKMSGGYNNGNAAMSNGGGVYMAGGRFEFSGGHIGYPNIKYKNTAINGAGVYMAGSGEFDMTGGSMRCNHATGNGGAIYMEGGQCHVSGGNIGSSGGLYYCNKAVKGGGIYSEGGSVDISNGNINYNRADYGGAIYADGGTIDFSNGTISENSATEAGGGIYVDEDGVMTLKGSSTLSKNHVPAGKNGGGVYLLGVITVGDEPTKALGTITAQDNYSGSSYQGASNRNNIYLANPVALPYTSIEPHKGVITLVENGINSTSSKVGFSVPRNLVPVLYCNYSSTSHAYLSKFSTGGDYAGVVFDDSESYKAVYGPYNPFFDPNHVYLYGFWPDNVTAEPSDFSIDNIDSAEDLAWLISRVNGLNGQAATSYENDSIILTADLDISRYGWVAVGTETYPFKGTFLGNGHTIDGIITLVYENFTEYGLFGVVNNGSVQDVFLKNASYTLIDKADLVIGGLASQLKGSASILNSEAQVDIVSLNSGSIMGGLVGRMESNGGLMPFVHSSIAVGEMDGYLMGGLVGQNQGGEVKNSFANVKFTNHGSNTYVGGLAAESTGAFENCYAHERTGSSHGSFYGSLVGDNGGTVSFCYANNTPYYNNGTAPTSHGLYADNTQVPYLYKRRDNQVALASGESNKYLPTEDGVDKQMLVALNRWVDTMNIKHSGDFAKWMRPTTKSINDDLPLLKMRSVDAVAGTLSDSYLAYGPVNDRMADYADDNQAAILLYRNNTSVNGNNGAAAKLYVAEDVALIQNSKLNAYVGITLDNSAGVNGAYADYFDPEADAPIDWHMFSTSLTDAPLGIDYTDTDSHEFDWGHPANMPYYRFYPEDNSRHGYFPSHTYNEDYPTSDMTLTGFPGNYYGEWDFYCYHEPATHWINFKRNKNSHWQLYDDDHSQIEYNNESKLVQGKGYLVATVDPTFLQAYGTLNDANVKIPLTYSEVPNRRGYNLIGNPYQAYLDFDAFAELNGGLWGGKEHASYTILDEDSTKYVTYAYGSSLNPFAGGQFIHPHQGFFVQVSANDTARFTPAMRNADNDLGVTFRNRRPAYPLVNLIAKEANGNSDIVTVELGRPDRGGALLMHELRLGKGRIWCSYEDHDYTIAFTQPGITEAAIRFETSGSATYTMTWNTQNGEFSYLHLIDNLTGADIDCLTTSEYIFTSRPSDYKSRFKLVFGYTGIEESEPAETSSTFAFIMGDELVVNGDGTLQLFDISGRQIASSKLMGQQNTLNLPGMANGIYMLRLTQGNSTKIQKLVISK